MNTNVVSLQNGNSQATGIPASSTTASVSQTPNPNQSIGKDDFMKLLMTQLQAQDPLNPQDSTAFVSQLTQFANLEGINNLGTKLDSLVTLTGANNAATAVSLLGKNVRLSGNKISGNGSVYYNLPQIAQSAMLEVRDAATGAIVKTMTGQATDAGLHEVKLTDLPAGKYTFDVMATDTGGKSIQADYSFADTVSGVSFANNAPVLLMNSGNQMNASDVVEIRQPNVTN